jgi:hypothetical protein
MNFQWKHYVPVLRYKRAELWAIQYLPLEARDYITPIIELIPTNFENGDGELVSEISTCARKIGERIWKAWGSREFFLDTGQISSIAEEVLDSLSGYASEQGIKGIPVLGISASNNELTTAKYAVAKLGAGACIRIKRADLEATSTEARISEIVSHLEISASDIDVVVDLGVSTGFPPFNHVRRKTPRLTDWRTFTVLSGSFPKDLQGMEPRLYRLRRTEWEHWTTELASSHAERKPSFGDYTVQYAFYVEPPKFANPSASIRYTTQREWLILRGEGIRNEDGPGRAQWSANAQLLRDLPEFNGSQFSRGDQEIAQRASRYSNPGVPTTWIQAAINHHMVLVAQQIANIGDDLTAIELPNQN